MNTKIQKMFSAIAVALAPAFVYAAGTVTGGTAVATGGQFSFTSWFNLGTAVAGLVFLVILLIGGIMYITAAGNEEASTKAKKLLVDAFIGMVVIAIAWSLGNWLISFLGTGFLSSVN